MFKTKLLSRMAYGVIFSTSVALADPSVDDYVTLLQSHSPRQSHVVVERQQENCGWLNSLRNQVGNGLRWFGDQVRKKEDLTTDISVMRGLAKEAVGDYVKSKTGVSVTQSMMSAFGNGVRWLGTKIRATDEKQNLERVIMNAGCIHATSKTENVIGELRKVSAAMAQTGADSTQYVDLVHAVQDRGHHVKEKAFQIYSEEVIRNVLRNESVQQDEATAKKNVLQRLASFFDKIGLTKSLSEVRQYVSDLFEKVKTWLKWEETLRA